MVIRVHPWEAKTFREARKPPPWRGLGRFLYAIASLEIRFSENFIVPCFRALASAMAYAIASDEIRFSEKSLAISFLSLASGRKTMRWPFTMLEGENSFWAITSAG